MIREFTILRIQDLEPGKKYKRIGFNGNLGEEIYTVNSKLNNLSKSINKLIRINVGSDSLLAATKYTTFIEIP